MKENAKFRKIRDQKTTTENCSDMENGLKFKIQSEAVWILNGSQIIIVLINSSTIGKHCSAFCVSNGECLMPDVGQESTWCFKIFYN